MESDTTATYEPRSLQKREKNNPTKSSTASWLFEQLTNDHHTPPALPSQGWTPPAHGVIFHFLTTLFEHLVPLKNTRAWHGVIVIHLLKYFKCLRQSFP